MINTVELRDNSLLKCVRCSKTIQLRSVWFLHNPRDRGRSSLMVCNDCHDESRSIVGTQKNREEDNRKKGRRKEV